MEPNKVQAALQTCFQRLKREFPLISELRISSTGNATNISCTLRSDYSGDEDLDDDEDHNTLNVIGQRFKALLQTQLPQARLVRAGSGRWILS